MRRPAYGRQLYDRRENGDHPDCVDLWVADKWFGAAQQGCLAIKPDEYAPGVFDFRVVAGIRCNVIDFAGAEQYVEISGAWSVYWLAAEIARWSPCVFVHSVMWPKDEGSPILFGEDIATIAWLERKPAAAPDVRSWPAWWPGDLAADYERRSGEYWNERQRILEAACRGGVRGCTQMAGAQ